MKIGKILCLLAAAGMTISAAAAQEAKSYYWTSREDPCYHIDAACGEDEEKYPISEASAIAFGKDACSACIAKAPVELQAVVRGGTYVVRVPGDALKNVSPERVQEEPAFSLNAAPHAVRNRLSKAQYAELTAQYEAEGIGQMNCAVPEVDCASGELSMNVRLVDDEWYLVVRPAKSYGPDNPFKWCAVEYRMRIDDFGTEVFKVGEEKHSRTISPENRGDAQDVFSRDYGKMQISVFREMGANIAVIHSKNESSHRYVQALRIDENEDAGILLCGYSDGKNSATYCCVLTDEEFGSLVAGKTPILNEVPFAIDDNTIQQG